jgi:exopolysaccharide production protein ExoZ
MTFQSYVVPTSHHPKHRLDLIEAARGIAAVLVVLYHVARHLDKAQVSSFWMVLLQFGHAGVDLFFVVSGFIILHVHYKDIGQSVRLWPYMKRRLTRIYPTYWLALVLTVILSVAGAHGWPNASDLVMSATLLPSRHEPLLGVAWTLQFEIVFYLVFAVLILHRWTGQVLIGIWLLCVSLQLMHYLPDWGLPSSLLAAYNLEFFFGMGVAFGFRHWKLPSAGALLLSGSAAFASCALLENFALVNGYANWMRVPYGLASALLIASCATAGHTAVQVPSWLKAAGSASYSIYLFQFIFIGVVWKVLGKLGWDGATVAHLDFLLLSAAGVLGGIGISRLIEYPLMAWIRRSLGSWGL